jgi:hypothetical protein
MTDQSAAIRVGRRSCGSLADPIPTLGPVRRPLANQHHGGSNLTLEFFTRYRQPSPKLALTLHNVLDILLISLSSYIQHGVAVSLDGIELASSISLV